MVVYMRIFPSFFFRSFVRSFYFNLPLKYLCSIVEEEEELSSELGKKKEKKKKKKHLKSNMIIKYKKRNIFPKKILVNIF